MKYFSLLLLCLTKIAFGQNFTILIEEGIVFEKKYVQKQGKNILKKIPLLSGEKIQQGTTIVLGKDGYLFLYHINGYSYEFLKPQTINIDSLDSVTSKLKPIRNKYLELYQSKLIEANQIDFSKNHNRYFIDVNAPMNRCPDGIVHAYLYNEGLKKGTIEESENMFLFNYHLFVRIFPKDKMFENPFTYIVELQDFYGKRLLKKSIEVQYPKEDLSTAVSLDLSELKLKDNEFIMILYIKELGEDVICNSYSFTIIDSKYKKQLLSDAPSLNPLPDDLAGHLQVLAFFEENRLLTDAFEYLERIITLRPNIQTFRILYDDFKVKYKMRSIPAPQNKGFKPELQVLRKDDYVMIFDKRGMETLVYLGIHPTYPKYLKSKYNKKY